MNIGFLFPGQGTQFVGMGKDIYENYEEARNIYDKVKELTGIDIAKISFEGPEEELNRTRYTQLAILTNSLSILEILKKNNINAKISAGLSLGEYSALIYSNALSFEEGIKIVQKRGEYMEELLPRGDWQMAAIMGLSEDQVIEVCNKVTKGFVAPANFNCEGQIVVSGEKDGVEEAEIFAKELGAKKVRILKTSGPFHTEKLIKSSVALRKELEKITINEFKTDVIKNIDGEKYSNIDDVKDILARHIINPVKFTKTLVNMLNEGIDTFIEIGPGKTLSGFVKRTPTEKKLNILNIGDVQSLENTINFVKENEENE